MKVEAELVKKHCTNCNKDPEPTNQNNDDTYEPGPSGDNNTLDETADKENC